MRRLAVGQGSDHETSTKLEDGWQRGDAYACRIIEDDEEVQTTAMNAVIRGQQAVCRKYGAPWFGALEHLKLGIARNVRRGLMPLNGLRHPPQGDTSGWYIWAGEEFSDDADFFEPLHVAHLVEWCPAALKYLGLPPGWRFLTAGAYEDVWVDPTLLDV